MRARLWRPHEVAETWKPERTLYVRPPEKVEVFTSSTPNRPYKELGIIEASHPGKLSKLVAAMRVRG
jgi:hypothetical protein